MTWNSASIGCKLLYKHCWFSETATVEARSNAKQPATISNNGTMIMNATIVAHIKCSIKWLNIYHEYLKVICYWTTIFIICVANSRYGINSNIDGNSMLHKVDPIFAFVIIAVIGVLLSSCIRPGKIPVMMKKVVIVVVILSIVIWKFQVVFIQKLAIMIPKANSHN